MTATPPQRYRVKVTGHLDDHWAGWLGDWTLQRDSDGTTTLDGEVEDQAQLHGLLTGLRDIGTTLLSVEADAPESSASQLTLTGNLATHRLPLREASADGAAT